MAGMDIAGRHRDSWQSFRSLPLWVRVWVGGILIPANAASFLLLDTASGQWIAGAALLVMASNYPIMLGCRGMSRLMSLPHLVIWTPLEVALLNRLISAAMPGPELALVLTVLVINGVSLVFDAIDSWRWCRGEREVPGHG